jgi:hypothetical protein
MSGMLLVHTDHRKLIALFSCAVITNNSFTSANIIINLIYNYWRRLHEQNNHELSLVAVQLFAEGRGKSMICEPLKNLRANQWQLWSNNCIQPHLTIDLNEHCSVVA